MEIGCIDSRNNSDLCGTHTKFFEERNPILRNDNQLSIYSAHPSFLYLPYGGSTMKLYPYQSYNNNYRIQENNKLNNNNNGNLQLHFQGSNLSGCCGNILRQKNSAEGSYAPINWENGGFPQYQYNTGNRIGSYGPEQTRTTTSLSNMPWNRNIYNRTQIQPFSKENCRSTTEPQIAQNFIRSSKIDVRSGIDNSQNFQKTIIEEGSDGRRHRIIPGKARFYERYCQNDTITGEPLPIRRTEYKESQRFFVENSYNPTSETKIEEKRINSETNMQKQLVPRFPQENQVGDTIRPQFTSYFITGNEISKCMPGNRKSVEEKISKGSIFPYETVYSNPRFQDFCGGIRRELPRFSRKDNEKTDCSCCCHINNDINPYNNIYSICNPLNIIRNDTSQRSYDNMNKPFNSSDLNQFRNKMEQRLSCHKQYCSDSDHGSDDGFQTLLMRRCSSNSTNQISNNSNNNDEQLSTIKENPSWRNLPNSPRDPRGEGDILPSPHYSNNNTTTKNYFSNPQSSDDETNMKVRRSVLQNRRGEGGKLLKQNNSIDGTSNSGYASNGGYGSNIHSSDDENIFKGRRSVLQNARGEGGRLLKSNSSLDRISNRSFTSNILSSDDEQQWNSHRCFLQCPRGEGGRVLRSNNSIDRINSKRYTTSVTSSDYENPLRYRRSILQNARGEGGRILTPKSSTHHLSNWSHSSNRNLSEDDNFFIPLPRNRPNTNSNYGISKRNSSNISEFNNFQSPTRKQRGSSPTKNNFNIFNSNRNSRTNYSSSEDDAFLKSRKSGILLERKPNFCTRNNRHRTSNPQSSDDENLFTTIRNISPLNSAQCCNTSNNSLRHKSSGTLNMPSTFDPITLKPRRNILQSQWGAGGRFLKRLDSNNSVNCKRTFSSQLTLFVPSSEDDTKKTTKKISEKFSNEIKPQDIRNFYSFTNSYQLPLCEPVNNNSKTALGCAFSGPIKVNTLKRGSLSTRSVPIASIHNSSVPVRRTNSTSPNNKHTINWENVNSTTDRKRKPVKTIKLDHKQNNQDRKNKNPSIFEYLNTIEKMTSNSKRGRCNGGRKKPAVNTSNFNKPINSKKTEIKSHSTNYKQDPIKVNIEPRKPNSRNIGKLVQKSMLFKYK